MWFKQINWYTLEHIASLEQLQEQMTPYLAKGCGPSALQACGWVAVSDNMLYANLNQIWLLRAQYEEKILPAAAIRCHVHKYIQHLEKTEDRKVTKKEKKWLADQAIAELSPNALIKTTNIDGVLDVQNGYLILPTYSQKLTEAFITLLRQTLGTLKVVAPVVPATLSNSMTTWVQDDTTLHDAFELSTSCDLHDPCHVSSTIRCNGFDVASTEIQQHINLGRKIIKIALVWQKRLGITLDHHGMIKRLKWLTDDIALQDDDIIGSLMLWLSDMHQMILDLRATGLYLS
jgi:recombination associated protein RdgC